jgi:hypothetical protein
LDLVLIFGNEHPLVVLLVEMQQTIGFSAIRKLVGVTILGVRPSHNKVHSVVGTDGQDVQAVELPQMVDLR